MIGGIFVVVLRKNTIAVCANTIAVSGSKKILVVDRQWRVGLFTSVEIYLFQVPPRRPTVACLPALKSTDSKYHVESR